MKAPDNWSGNFKNVDAVKVKLCAVKCGENKRKPGMCHNGSSDVKVQSKPIVSRHNTAARDGGGRW